jgi:uncharacterized protein GlcG (DUF336 family)
MTILDRLFYRKRSSQSAKVSSPRFFRPQLEILETRETPALVSSQVAPLVVQPPPVVLQPGEVGALLDRAAAADSNDDGIVVIVDRGGRILGVRVEGNVSTAITSNPEKLTFAIDGALALARTAAFFSNNSTPLTSRTIEFISQSTITQSMVDSDPNITDTNSPAYGPGLVAPIGTGGHFPPNVDFTPQVDLSGIELTNRDTSVKDGVLLPSRFNVPQQYVPIPPTDQLAAPDSYGYISGLDPTAQPRGIGTLPGGLPIFLNGQLVGGIGVFFPGTTGYASAENSNLSSDYNPTMVDRSEEAEYDAYAALGGSAAAGFTVGSLGGVAPVAGISLPFGRIDLNGITLNIYGPGGQQGPQNLVQFGQSFQPGNPNSGTNMPVDKMGDTLITGVPVASGWLVTPHDGVGITAAQVETMINQGIAQAEATRSAIRLPLGQHAAMVFAVTDSTGAVLGLYRMPDATVFSIDVAVAKARNVAYYDDPSQLLSVDQVPGLPAGASLTNRTFQYLEQPRYPLGIDGSTPGPFSILNSPGVNTATALNEGPPLPASDYQGMVYGYAAYNPGTNFHAQTSPLNQNGVVFFPGSSAVYMNNGTKIVGGFGVSGDGVTEDDAVTAAGINGFAPAAILRADQYFVRGVRLPYQEFDRNVEG